MSVLRRLLSPQNVVVIGGGVWGRSVIEQCQKLGFEGKIFAVHPTAETLAGVPTYRSVSDLPNAPDAAFIGVNRIATIEQVRTLSAKGAGGAVCFASGFLETKDEDADGAALQSALIEAAGVMPIIGPNCYGFVNYLDRFCLWPDQHGGRAVDTGVAIVTQSSNIMINLSMQQRGLPIAYALTAGNQAQTSLAALGRAVLDDPRVTALGLYIEGIGDLKDFENLARHASTLNKSIVALKVGWSEQAQQATISHTASLAGSATSADALLARLGVARVNSLAEMVEALKILHQVGPLAGKRLVSASCSGGEASLMADTAHRQQNGVVFPALNQTQRDGLRSVLGEKVALANPLDYHTYVWGNLPAMADVYSAILDAPIDFGIIVVDFPRADRCDGAAWDYVIEAAQIAQKRTSKAVALLASLPENMPEDRALQIAKAGLVPLCGLEVGLAAIASVASVHPVPEASVIAAPRLCQTHILDEVESKAILAEYGVDLPHFIVVAQGSLPETLPFSYPVVLKAIGENHKSEMGGVIIGLSNRAKLEIAMLEMDQPRYIIEELITDPIAELLVGIVGDQVHGYVLTLAAGGVLTELLRDSVSLSLPVNQIDILAALQRLKLAPMLAGYRGKPAVDKAALVRAVLAMQACVLDRRTSLAEIEINPLILTPKSAVAVDALIRIGENADA
ncbi:MAG: acetate--CoA ligase family protein [Proteobacteria bacterium]|nr:acetate--CoA ligase family protein [Pseudomonadota bacterium]MDA1150214.1 acetate--CoA ligase family protein [Pseudomonadota bacterium]